MKVGWSFVEVLKVVPALLSHRQILTSDYGRLVKVGWSFIKVLKVVPTLLSHCQRKKPDT